MEIRPSHANGARFQEVPKGPSRSLLTNRILVVEATNSLFTDTIPANDRAAKMQWKMARSVSQKSTNRDAGKADLKMDQFRANKSCMTQAAEWNPSSSSSPAHKKQKHH